MPDTQLLFQRYASLYKKHSNVARWWQEISTRASWQKVNAQSEFKLWEGYGIQLFVADWNVNKQSFNVHKFSPN